MRSRATAYPLVAVLGWGVMFPILASALDRVDPLNLTTARYLLAAVVLVAILLLREGAGALRHGGRALEVVVLGVVGFAGFNLLTNLALEHAAPQQISLFVATTPVITQLVRWARDGVRPKPLAAGPLPGGAPRRRSGDHARQPGRARPVRPRRAA